MMKKIIQIIPANPEDKAILNFKNDIAQILAKIFCYALVDDGQGTYVEGMIRSGYKLILISDLKDGYEFNSYDE